MEEHAMAMGRPRAFDADKALDEAMEVFWRHGYDGATIAQLTKAMGINPPSLYAAFGSKEELLKAALDRYSAKRAEFMCDVLSAPTAREVAGRMLLRDKRGGTSARPARRADWCVCAGSVPPSPQRSCRCCSTW